MVRVKRAAALLFCDRCTVYEKFPTEKDGRTDFETRARYENVPCRVSSKSYLFGENAASDGKNTAEVKKMVKLFLPPEYEIAPGSTIEVKRLGKTERYAKSGAVMRYESHSEVMMTLLKDYA